MTGLVSRVLLLTRALPALALASVTGLAFFLRVFCSYDNVFQGDWVRFKGFDPWYHVRLIENLVQNFPQRLTFDPFTYFPHGQDVFFAPLYDYMVSSIAWIWGAGSPSPGTTETLAAYFPAVLGALVTVPVFYLGKALFSRTVGLVAAALVILLPGQFLLRSTLGFTDHHVAETLFSTLTMMFLVLAVKSAREREVSFGSVAARSWVKLRRPLIYSLLAGAALGAYLTTWVGGALFVLIIFIFAFAQYTIDHLRGKRTDYLCVTAVPCFSMALLLLAPFAGQYAYGNMQALSLVVGAAAFIGLSGLSIAMARRGIKPIYYPLAVLVLSGAAFAVSYAISPETLSKILGELRWLNPGGASLTIGEMRPLTLTMAWEEFTTSFYLALVSLVALAYLVIREGAAEKTLLLVWSLVVLVAMLSENRFAYYFAVNVSLLTAFIVWKAVLLAAARVLPKRPDAQTAAAAESAGAQKQKARTGKGSKRKKARRARSGQGLQIAGYTLSRIGFGLAAAVMVFFLVFYPNIGMAIDVAKVTTSQVSVWREPLLWMRENTPDPFDDPDFFNQVYERPPKGQEYDYPESAYGVMAWWDYGHWITQIAHRVPNANPHQLGATAAADFFTLQDESSANEVMNGRGSRYVAVDLWTALHEIDPARGKYGNFHGVIEWADREQDEFYEVFYQKTDAGALEPVILYHPAYYRSMAARLFIFAGEEVVPENSTYAISYEDRTASDGEPYKEITSIRRFATYEDAVEFLEEQTDPSFQIMGYSQLRSPVHLEKLKHYELVHESVPPTPEPGQVALSEVRIFEYTP